MILGRFVSAQAKPGMVQKYSESGNILALLPQLNIQFILTPHSARWRSLHAGLPTFGGYRRKLMY